MAEVTHEQIIENMESARKMKKLYLSELDHRKGIRGFITFQDIQDAVAQRVDKEIAPALFEACVRIAESERVVTIFN